MRKPIFAFEKYSTKLSIFGLLLTLCGGACGIAAAAFYSKPQATYAEEASWTPEEEQQVERSELAVTVTSSALTDTSQSVGTVFRSQKIDVANNGPQYKNVFLAPNDENFTTFDQVVNECKAAKTEATAAGTEYVAPDFEATVYNIQYNKNATPRMAKTIVIPEYVQYSTYFRFHVSSISSSVVFNQRSGETEYGSIERIIIPKSVTSIADGAFVDVPDNVEILVEADETYDDGEGGEVKTYPNEWTDSENVTFGYELSSDEQKLLNPKSENYISLGKGSDFFLGIYDDDNYYPLYMEYKFQVPDGDDWRTLDTKHYIRVPLSSTNTNYDAVGSIMGVNSISPFIEIDIPANHRVDVHSIVFHNIYRAVSEVKDGVPRMVPDLVTGPLCSVPAVSNFTMPHFSDLFAMKQNSSSSLSGFLHFDVILTRQEFDGYGIYPELNPTLFAQQKEEIDAKTVQIRYQFSTLDRAYYRFTFEENGQETSLTTRLDTPVSYVLVGHGDVKFGFLVNASKLEGHSFQSLKKVELCRFNIKLDLYKESTNSILTKSGVSIRFAALELFENIHTVPHTDVGMILIIAYIVYVGAYAMLATAYYFYAKRRFRNDEFRRVNNRRYLIGALKNFVGCGLILSAVLFIVARWAMLNSSVVVFNPVDVFVIIFALLAAIYIGFSIKNLVITIKNIRKRRQAARLHLDDDVVDDGTH